MGRCNRDNCLSPCLVHLRELMEKHERELVILIGNLDHVAVHRVECGGILTDISCPVMMIRFALPE